MNKLDRFLGCMYGLAIGDALGFPVEFFDLEEIKRQRGSQGVQDFEPYCGLKAGTYTDDTEMSLAVARGLLKTQDVKATEIVIEDICKEFIEWGKNCNLCRSPGKTCLRGVENLVKGVSWQKSGIKDMKGCGAAMRSAPIGLVYHNDLAGLVKITDAVSRATHAHPTGIAAGIGTAGLVYLALDSCKLEDIADRICEITKSADEKGEFKEKIKQIKEVWNLPTEDAIKRLGEGWVGEEAVAIALYCFLKSPNDYRKTVLRAVNISGDSDSVGCIAGAISGAYNGINGIPEEWVENIEDSELIGKLAKELYERAK